MLLQIRIRRELKLREERIAQLLRILRMLREVRELLKILIKAL